MICSACVKGKKTFKKDDVSIEMHGCETHDEAILIKDKTHYKVTYCAWNRNTNIPGGLTQMHFENIAQTFFNAWPSLKNKIKL